MALIKANSDSSSGGGGSLKDIIYDKVFNGGFTQYSITPYNNYCTISEGKIAVDTTNRKCYLYCDFTMIQNVGGSSWYALGETNMPATYMLGLGDSQYKGLPVYTDESSTTNKALQLTQYNSYIFLGTAYNTSFANGERYIVYAMWSY